MRPDFHGIYPMLYAFFGRDGALDRGAMRRQVEGCIAAGVHGLAVGGLASECNKLATAERRRMLEWVLEDAKGRVPVSVTIAENSIAGQGEMAQAAAQAGARWVVLQPPPVRGASEAELIRFYGAVAEKCALPVGIQNAPEYIGIGVSNAGFAELNRRHPNVSIVKAEGPATYIDALARDTGGVFCLFNGRNGVELVDSLRAGCQGLIPGVESCDAQARIFDLFRNGEEAQADREYAELLPLLHFLMQGIDRLGEVFDRAPAVQPTAFGLAVAERWSRALPALPG
jgi:2-keto-3-deoxy-L-arabinonate dehydratase